MTRYHVVVTIGPESYDDHEGVELDGPETACLEAQQVAWELWQELPYGNKGPVTVRVIDSAGTLIHMITFPDPDSAKH